MCPARAATPGGWARCGCATSEGVDFLLGTGFSDAEREHAAGRRQRWSATPTAAITADGVPRFASFLRLREL